MTIEGTTHEQAEAGVQAAVEQARAESATPAGSPAAAPDASAQSGDEPASTDEPRGTQTPVGSTEPVEQASPRADADEPPAAQAAQPTAAAPAGQASAGQASAGQASAVPAAAPADQASAAPAEQSPAEPVEQSTAPAHEPAAEPWPTAASSAFGRIDQAGAVFVRTQDGERQVGSWQAGTAEEGLAHFGRRFEVLSTEVALLEQRLRSGVGDPQQVASTATRITASLTTASVVGDVAALERRLDVLLERTADAVEAGRVKKAEARARAVQAKRGLVEQAEQLAGTSSWKDSGERLRTIGDEWKRLPHADRKVEDELWERLAAARRQFAERRTAHFGALEQQREVSQQRKHAIIADAESLSSSTEWGPTAARYKQLMSDWKGAGRAPHEVEDQLWARFKAAQDAFFTARNAHFSVQDEELRGNQQVKEAILSEAETIDPAQGLDRAKARLRTLQERWEDAGKVPRDVMRSLEGRMAAVEEKIRTAGESRYKRQDESPFTVRLREKVAELEGKLDKARAAGRPTEELEAALQTQRQWLSQAGGGPATGEPAEPSGGRPADRPARKKPTTAWVRAE